MKVANQKMDPLSGRKMSDFTLTMTVAGTEGRILTTIQEQSYNWEQLFCHFQCCFIQLKPGIQFEVEIRKQKCFIPSCQI